MKTTKCFLAAAICISAISFTFFGCSSDSDDSDNYESVVIGTQTWMKKNLSIETEGSWCYDEDSASCETYGRLYTWQAAMVACPSGWHLPSNAEWQTLVDFAGGEETAGAKLKSVSGWNSGGNGTDDFGFSALPGGYRYSDGDFNSAGDRGSWWSATENGGYASYAYFRYMDDDNDYVGRADNDKNSGFSVRCLRN
jgi:uncharacterized protein (TIGR02145 family)